MAGCLLALALTLTASVAGVSAFMLARAGRLRGAEVCRRRLPDLPRHPGVARAGRRTRAMQASPRETASRWSHFRGGFLVGISNPKLLVFAAAFFPQFIAPDAPWVPQFALLVATFLADRGVRLCHSRLERARTGALSRARRLAAARSIASAA